VDDSLVYRIEVTFINEYNWAQVLLLNDVTGQVLTRY